MTHAASLEAVQVPPLSLELNGAGQSLAPLYQLMFVFW